jgi:hypothetical protein
MKIRKAKLRATYYAPDINMTGVYFTNELSEQLKIVKKNNRIRSEGVRLIVDYKPYNSKSKYNYTIKSKRKIYWLDKLKKIIGI